MAKTQKNIRISAETERKLSVLAGDDYYGTEVEAISIAIDRLYREIKPTDEERLRAGVPVPCAECGQPVTPGSPWEAGHYGEIYHAECIREEKMNRQIIMEQLNADDWSTVVGKFDAMDASEIKAELDAMLPDEDSADLAQAIEVALAETRICILVMEDNGAYEVHPNAKPEAWIDIIGQRDVSNAIPIEELHGWGRWQWAYRVQYGREEFIYFVNSTPDVTERD